MIAQRLWVASSMTMAAAAAAAAGRRSGSGHEHRCIAADAGLRQPALVLAPQVFLLRAEEEQVVPGKYAAVVPIGK